MADVYHIDSSNSFSLHINFIFIRWRFNGGLFTRPQKIKGIAVGGGGLQ